MHLLILVVSSLFYFKQIVGVPTDMKKHKQYLVQFGYMDKSGMLDENYKMVQEATMRFQKFFNLPLTGKMNKKTAEMMSISRCGNPDMKLNQRSKRYAFYCPNGSPEKREVYEMTYRIKNYPYSNNLDKTATRMQIRRAFAYWTRFTNITFRETDENENIEVSFEKGKHEYDDEGFDGPNGVLAHAYLPPTRGSVHFDIEENWSVDDDNSKNIDLLQVAVHEIGHHLGLSHSKVLGSVMYPMYTYDPLFDLENDDIKGIQELYSNNADPFNCE